MVVGTTACAKDKANASGRNLSGTGPQSSVVHSKTEPLTEVNGPKTNTTDKENTSTLGSSMKEAGSTGRNTVKDNISSQMEGHTRADSFMTCFTARVTL